MHLLKFLYALLFFMWVNLELFTMSDEDRMRSEIQRMQMRGDELTDQVDKCSNIMLRLRKLLHCDWWRAGQFFTSLVNF